MPKKSKGWAKEPRRHALSAYGIPNKITKKKTAATQVTGKLFPQHVLEQIKEYNEIADGREWIAEFDLVNGSILMNDFQFSDDVDASYLNWDGERDSIYNVGYIHYHPDNLVPMFTAQDFVLGCRLHNMRTEGSKEKLGYTLMGLVVKDRIILIAVKPGEKRQKQFEDMIDTDGSPDAVEKLRKIVGEMQNRGELLRFNDVGLDGSNMGKAGGLII